ncbi:TetR family transcriptional regulator [Mycobacteroides abscessus]
MLIAVREEDFQRARTDEHKRQRATAMLEAARSLATEIGVSSVTLTALADRAGIHHSAVRRYYSSYKEVLLLLGQERWEEWASQVCQQLDAEESASPVQIAEILAVQLAADPLFCDLLTNLPLHLEREVPPEQVVQFRVSALESIEQVAGAIRRACLLFNDQAAIDAVAAACALAAIFWQSTNPPPELAELLGPDYLPRAWNMQFLPALTRVLSATCLGLAHRS